jgi:uncharacterized Zn finger protein
VCFIDPTWQVAPNGIVLMAHCEGSDGNSYRLRVELDSGGVQSASCTCPYDWGGDCKHIIALLLMYLRQPEEFTEQKALDVLLAGLEKADLLALITRLVQNNPDLYDEVELLIPAAKLAAQPPHPQKKNVPPRSRKISFASKSDAFSNKAAMRKNTKNGAAARHIWTI